MDDFEYLDPKDLNELVIHIKKAQKEKKDLTFSFEYATLEESKNSKSIREK